jgi:hypothetical protein
MMHSDVTAGDCLLKDYAVPKKPKASVDDCHILSNM